MGRLIRLICSGELRLGLGLGLGLGLRLARLQPEADPYARVERRKQRLRLRHFVRRAEQIGGLGRREQTHTHAREPHAEHLLLG